MNPYVDFIVICIGIAAVSAYSSYKSRGSIQRLSSALFAIWALIGAITLMTQPPAVVHSIRWYLWVGVFIATAIVMLVLRFFKSGSRS